MVNTMEAMELQDRRILSPDALYEKEVSNHVIFKDGKEITTKIVYCSQCDNQIEFSDSDIKTNLEVIEKIHGKECFDPGATFVYRNIYLAGYIICPNCNRKIRVKKLYLDTMDGERIH